MYDILTEDDAQTFATLGGLLYPEHTTEHLIGKDLGFKSNAEGVAKVHLYRDAELYGRDLHKKGIGHRKLAKLFKMPSYLYL